MIIDKIYLRKALLIELNALFDPSTERAKNAISPPSSKIVRIKVLRTSKASLFFCENFLVTKISSNLSTKQRGFFRYFCTNYKQNFCKIPLLCVICKKPICDDFKHATS